MDIPKMIRVTVTGIRDQRYGELLVVTPAGVDAYNTTGLNECPADLWDALDLAAITMQMNALSVQKNGPHFWMMDEQTLSVAEEQVSFGGIEARWAARAPLSVVQKGSKGSPPYVLYTPKKTQRMLYAKGKPVFEVVDPDGNAYVLQAREEQFPMASLHTLGERMALLPPGWKYRSRVLEADLVLDLGPDQTIYAVGDEFHQYYTRI